MFWPGLFFWEVGKYILGTTAGIAVFQNAGHRFFGFDLLGGFREIRNLHGPFLYWSCLASLFLTMACWSVGGAAMYFLYLLWKWSRLYRAGDK